MPDPDDLPPDWGHSEDPYAPVSESDAEIPEPPPGDELPPMEEGESPDKPEDKAPVRTDSPEPGPEDSGPSGAGNRG